MAVINIVQAQEMGKAPELTSCHYAKGALQYLVPLLTGIMTKQVSSKSNL